MRLANLDSETTESYKNSSKAGTSDRQMKRNMKQMGFKPYYDGRDQEMTPGQWFKASYSFLSYTKIDYDKTEFRD